LRIIETVLLPGNAKKIAVNKYRLTHPYKTALVTLAVTSTSAQFFFRQRHGHRHPRTEHQHQPSCYRYLYSGHPFRGAYTVCHAHLFIQLQVLPGKTLTVGKRITLGNGRCISNGPTATAQTWLQYPDVRGMNRNRIAESGSR